jgi:putative membrane protein
MIVRKNISFFGLLQWSYHHFIWLLFMMSIIATGYGLKLITFHIPWVPISVIGTAVAFYAGFKNNQAYDRMWEARKIWGAIVNESRTWGSYVDGYITNTFRENKLTDKELAKIKQLLIYRHIGWLYAHRSQLLVSTEWEHINQGGHTAKFAKRYQDRFGVGLIDDDVTRTELKNFLPTDEYDKLVNATNTATQILNEQSRTLQALRNDAVIDDFRHMEMMSVIRSLYTQQGKNERIKKFPLPRQYANISRYFVGIFIMLFPFSMIPSMMDLGNWGLYLSVPIAVLVGWVYVMMEVIGDYSENPFQGMANDIPMLSLCRTIEIDLREILNEKDIPPPIEAKKGILM